MALGTSARATVPATGSTGSRRTRPKYPRWCGLPDRSAIRSSSRPRKSTSSSSNGRAPCSRSAEARHQSIDEIQLEALRVFVTSLEKNRYGAADRRKPEPEPRPAPMPAPTPEPTPTFASKLGPTTDSHPEPDSDSTREPEPDSDSTPDPRRCPRPRHVPARVRRAVFDRDGARCTVDATGRRCEQTHYLELHHGEPFALGGEHSEANLALRCAAHNALAAELDFGPLQIAAKRDALRHLPSSVAARCTCPTHAPAQLQPR